MKTLTSESYNIAWFKLADFVARKEKERALSVLRLLMHSISDEALTYQLEGDILQAFQDYSAIDRYHAAAQMYQKLGKFQQAISSHHYAIRFQENEKTLSAILQLYIALEDKAGISSSFSKMADYIITTKNSDYLIDVTHAIAAPLPLNIQTLLQTQLTVSILLYDADYKKISELIQNTLNFLQQDLKTAHTSSHLSQFLADLKILNFKEYKKAELYLKDV